LRERFGLRSGIALAMLLALAAASPAPAMAQDPSPVPSQAPEPDKTEQKAPAAAPANGPGSTATAEAVPTRVDIARSLIVSHAARGYRGFAAESAKQVGAVAELCGAPGEKRLENARAGFRAMALSWQAVQHIRFGPVMEDDRFRRIEYWPDGTGKLETDLANLLGDPARMLAAANSVAELGPHLQGLTLLERILFDSHSAMLADGNGDNAARCKLAHSVARHLAGIARAIAEGWQKDYVSQAETLDEPRAAEILGQLRRSLLDELDTIITLKLGLPLASSPESARPHLAELWRSDLAVRSLTVNLQALGEVYNGQSNGKAMGLGFIVEISEQPDVVDAGKAVAEELAAAASMLADQPGLLGNILHSKAGWTKADTLKRNLATLRERVAFALAQSLDDDAASQP
jgi:predicted lipoprotein